MIFSSVQSFQRTLLAAWVVLTGPFAALTWGAGESRSPDTDVDRTIVLRVGALKVSQYGIDKNYRRVLKITEEQHRPPPTTAEVRQWFELFLAQRMVIAQAISIGYNERPEVGRMVDTMERYMLSQPEGPFYKTLYPEDRLPDERLASLYAHAGREVEVIALMFPTRQRDTVLGIDWSRISTEERLHRLASHREAAGITYYEGLLQWPYDPFGEAAEALAQSEPGIWLESGNGSFPDAENWVLLVHAVHDHLMPDFGAAREGFARFVHEHRKWEVRQRRQSELLRAAQFTFDEIVGAQIVDRLVPLPASATEVPSDVVTLTKDKRLGRYVAEGAVIEITGEVWRDYYNRLFLRQLPTDLSRLRQSVADLVVADLDCREARRRGLDRTPQFIEDRNNFFYAQILDLFEKERLATLVKITEAEIASYFRDHIGELGGTPHVGGRLLHFDDEKDALTWLQRDQRAANRPDLHPVTGLIAEAHCDVSPVKPVLGMEPFTPAILYGPAGQTFGPVKAEGQWLVFVKEGESRLEAASTETASPEIRRILTRRKIEQLELDLARELYGRFEVYDSIPYARYGLDGRVAPWGARAGIKAGP